MEEVKDELDGLKEQHKIWESELSRKQKEMEDDLAAMARRLQRREEGLNKYRETIRLVHIFLSSNLPFPKNWKHSIF
jgi:hypothetical protein